LNRKKWGLFEKTQFAKKWPVGSRYDIRRPSEWLSALSNGTRPSSRARLNSRGKKVSHRASKGVAKVIIFPYTTWQHSAVGGGAKMRFRALPPACTKGESGHKKNLAVIPLPGTGRFKTVDLAAETENTKYATSAQPRGWRLQDGGASFLDLKESSVYKYIVLIRRNEFRCTNTLF